MPLLVAVLPDPTARSSTSIRCITAICPAELPTVCKDSRNPAHVAVPNGTTWEPLGGMSGESSSCPVSTTNRGKAQSSRRLTLPSMPYAPVRITVSPYALLPQLPTPWRISSASGRPSRVVQCWPGWMTTLIGLDSESAMVTSKGRSLLGRHRPGPPAHHCGHRQRQLVLEPY